MTGEHLIDAIIELVSDPIQGDAHHAQAVSRLRASLAVVRTQTMGAMDTTFVSALIAAAASADIADPSHCGWCVLRAFLEQWYADHAGNKMISTIDRAAQATSKRKVKDEHGQPRKDAQGKPMTEVVQTYTPEQVSHIKLALTLRRALVARHEAQVITTRAMALVVLALRQCSNTQTFAWLSTAITQRFTNTRIHAALALLLVVQRQVHDEACHRIFVTINQRCAGKRIFAVIEVLVELVSRHIPAADNKPAVADTVRHYLYQLNRGMKQRRKPHHVAQVDENVPADETAHADMALSVDEKPQPVRPLLLRIVDALVCINEHTDILPLWMCLEHWYNSFAEKEREERFSAGDRRLIAIARDPTRQDEAGDRHTGMSLLLFHWLQYHCVLSTDVLLLVSLSEKAMRRIGDGDTVLSGILSDCYGEVCSRYQYPLSGELREGVFFNRGGAILGWCQLVADYVAERDKRRPGNTLPPRKKGKHKNVSRVDLFKGNRVVRISLAYALWKREDAAYKEAVATAAPVGPDEGKTLGNPHAHTELRRQVAGNRRRRVTILGRGIIGKRGARRMKKWMLPAAERRGKRKLLIVPPSGNLGVSKPTSRASEGAWGEQELPLPRETLRHLDVLLYPELKWSDEERVAAARAPHPYWVKRTKRGITAVRPTQFRLYPSTYPKSLKDLSREKQIQLREELREQERYAPQFAPFRHALDRFLEAAPPAPPFIAPIMLTAADMAQLPPEAQLEWTGTFETYKAEFDQNLNWYRDFRPSRGESTEEYSDEKLYDVETLRNRELEWSAATLAQRHPQPIYFKRGMNAELKPRSFALLYHIQQRNGRARYRFTFVCDLVGETAPEREALLTKRRARGEHTVENFLVNHPDQRVTHPNETTLHYFATQMGADHQERILLEYMDWRRREPERMKPLISTARIVSHKRTRQRTDWYAHLPVPLPAPTHTATLDAVIGFHEHEGTFYYATLDLDGNLLALGEVVLPDFVRPRRQDGMTSDNFAFETAVHILRRSMTRQYAHRLRDNPRRYTAFIGIEDTGWKQDLVGTNAADNRENVSLPRQRIIEIVTYKAVRDGLPTPLSMHVISPSRDCGHCGARIEAGSGIKKRSVTHCFHCQTLGIEHELEWHKEADKKWSARCTTCGRSWQKEEPQFKCQHCRTQQYARYNTALATVHCTVDSLVGRKRNTPDSEQE